MTNGNLIDQGLDLMLYGMGTVFVFLTLLVVVTVLMSSVIRKWMPEVEEKPAANTPSVGKNVDPRIISVIKAAVDKHRSRHNH